MPGPMSIPNGTNPTVKIVEDDVARYVPLAQLTGAERAWLASRRRITTGKTQKKRNRERS